MSAYIGVAYTTEEINAIELIVDGNYVFTKEDGCYVAQRVGRPECEKIKEKDLDFFIGYLVKQEMNA